MALFFDSRWFDEQLHAHGLSRDSLARHLNLTREDVDMIFKDQRELSANEVRLLAAFVNQPISEVVKRAGVSTPVPLEEAKQTADPSDVLNDFNDRLDRIERTLAELKQLLIEKG